MNIDKEKILFKSNSIISDYDRFIMTTLYTPIIGNDSLSLYLNMTAMIKVEDQEQDLDDVFNRMNLNINSFNKAKNKLEALGLVKSYIKDFNNKRINLLMIYAPKKPNDFFNDIILSGLLKRCIGDISFNSLKKHFYKDISLEGFKEVTSSFSESFSVDLNENSFVYNPKKNDYVVSVKRSQPNIVINTDELAYRLSVIDKVSIKDLSKDELQLIASLWQLYGLNVELVAQFVSDSINNNKIVGSKLDRNFFASKCYNATCFQSVIRPKKGRKSKIYGDSLMAKKIKQLDSLNPIDYLSLLQNNVKPVQSDMNIIIELVNNLGLPYPVCNALIDYVLEINNNILSKALTLKIGASLLREGCLSAEEAMSYLKNNNTKTKYEENKNERPHSIKDSNSQKSDVENNSKICEEEIEEIRKMMEDI